MVITKRRCLKLLAATALLSASGAALADYPTRHIRLVVPWPAGGLVDIAARTIADEAKDDLGHALIIENAAGAGGSIGAAAVARAEPDGYTLLFTTSALNMNASIRSKLPYDVEKDFIPIIEVATAPLILVAHPKLGVKSAGALVALAKPSRARSPTRQPASAARRISQPKCYGSAPVSISATSPTGERPKR